MELFVAGGVGEHGRNCFFVAGSSLPFLVDCGRMAEEGKDPYPHLEPEQIASLGAVFLTHSHGDHTGALLWLRGRGYRGPIIASRECLRQLPFSEGPVMALEALSADRQGRFQTLTFSWGRSGHCSGSVWYRFVREGRAFLFSGDYSESSSFYEVDPIRNQEADLAVLDCAYGRREESFDRACRAIFSWVDQHREGGPLLFPVPRFGRGFELWRHLRERGCDLPFFADAEFMENFRHLSRESFWIKKPLPVEIEGRGETMTLFSPSLEEGQEPGRGVYFLSDPQLRKPPSQHFAERVLRQGGHLLFTGTLEKGSYGEKLMGEGRADHLFYPVHLNFRQFRDLLSKNRFQRALAYHSPDFGTRDVFHS